MDEEEDENNIPFQQLMQHFHSYLKTFPIIRFISGKYDLNVIKKYITAYLQDDNANVEENDRSPFYVIKKNNNFMCLSTDTLKYLYISNYLAPGFSYDIFEGLWLHVDKMLSSI